ncbi:ABC transporter permease [Bacillus nitratireducens]|uniref:ABC transporter permease n=1 Tax=Bacillus nitratireducens TaxID=2026193 RepID=UPI001BAA5990|nr:ABC transporter permease [Bacillus nitratireducens]QUG82682.1 ABC transporter permease [Bacillus nitratireducens]
MYLVFKNIKRNKLLSIILLTSFFISFLSISVAALLTESKGNFIAAFQIGFPEMNQMLTVPIDNETELKSIIPFIQDAFVKSDIHVENLKVLDSSGAIKVIAVNLKDEYYWTPYISEGQYFHRENVNDMVVGDRANVEELYEFDGTYKKIGTISRKDSDVGVSDIYIPLQNLPTLSKKSIVASKQLQLTVVNPTSSIHNEIKTFMDRSKEVLSGDVQILNERDFQTLHVTHIAPSNKYYYKFILVAIVSGLSAVLFWIYKKEREISLKKAVGASNLSIYYELYIQILVIALAAMLLDFLTLEIFSGIIHAYFQTYLLKPLTPYVLICNVVFIIFLTMFVTVFSIKHIINIYPGKHLRT